jgi:hypothetical protein
VKAVTLENLFILGAGFSKNAGLPLQAEFTERLIFAGRDEDPTRAIVPYLRQFIAEAFGHLEKAKPDYWPDLEDIFTCIDLAANTGHNLGFTFPPSGLRKVRRALIARIIGMLRAEYERAKKERPEGWDGLQAFFRSLDLQRSAFLNLNWDTVLEEGVTTHHGTTEFLYGCGARHASFPDRGMVIALDKQRFSRKLRIIKMHGSVNWLYCDCCQRLYWFPPGDSFKVATQILRAEEWQAIDPKWFRTEWTCIHCKDVPLGTRLATFTYLKALDFPMFQKSWFSAEKLLRTARKWIFIGYSLPSADYEFKYLLKRIQLSRLREPEIIIITKNSPTTADSTYRNYQRFFGLTVKERNCFSNGLSSDAIDRILETKKRRRTARKLVKRK